MTEITLVRHAQASFGTPDYDRLSALGHQQSRWLGDHAAAQGWAYDQVLRGGLRRHRETAEGIAAGLDLPTVEVDPGFDELHYDSLEAAYHAATGAKPPRPGPSF